MTTKHADPADLRRRADEAQAAAAAAAEAARQAEQAEAARQQQRLDDYDRKLIEDYDPADDDHAIATAAEQVTRAVTEDPVLAALRDLNVARGNAYGRWSEAHNAAAALGVDLDQPQRGPAGDIDLTALLAEVTRTAADQAREAADQRAADRVAHGRARN